MDVVTLALAKKYARQVGSTIESITATDTGIHFATSTGEFDVNLEGWTGTEDYLKLINKPLINDVELVDNKTLNELGISKVGETGNYNDLNNKPSIPTKTSELTNDSDFITNAVDNLINYYKKTETFTQQEIQDLIRTVSGLQMQVVDQLPVESIDTNTIYLLKVEGTNSYEQWIYSSNQWFKLGTTDVSLVDYYTKTQIDEKFVQKEIGKTLSSNDFTNADKTKLDSVEAGANNYTLPIATDNILGGVKIGKNLSVSTDGKLNAEITGSNGTVVTVEGIAQETWNADTKANLSDIPTKTSQLENDNNFISNISIATDTNFGGIKAVQKTDKDNIEVKIDSLTGRLYVESPISTEINYVFNITANGMLDLTGSNLFINDQVFSLKGIQDTIIYSPNESENLLNVSLSDIDGYITPDPFTINVDSTGLKIFNLNYIRPFLGGYAYKGADPAVVRLGDYKDKTYNIATSLDQVVKNDFDDLFPYSQMKIVELEGNTMVEIPRIWIKPIQSTDTINEETGWSGYWISDVQYDETFVTHDFFRNSSGVGYGNKSYIASYLTNTSGKSQTNSIINGNQTRSYYRQQAKSLGQGWSQLDFTAMHLLQFILVPPVFGTRDIQSVIPRTRDSVSNISIDITTAKSTILNNNGINGLLLNSFYGIVDFYGNYNTWADGININSRQIYVCYNIDKFVDDTYTDYEFVKYSIPYATSTTLSTYVTEFGMDNDFPCVACPTVGNGSSTSYFCARAYVRNGQWSTYVFGGAGSNDNIYTTKILYLSSATNSNIASRLIKKPIQ